MDDTPLLTRYCQCMFVSQILSALTNTYRLRVDKRMISFYKSLTPSWVKIEEGESG
jgi:hypothetical protein